MRLKILCYTLIIIYVIIILIFIIELFRLYRYSKCLDNNFNYKYCSLYKNF